MINTERKRFWYGLGIATLAGGYAQGFEKGWILIIIGAAALSYGSDREE